jgi:hypothetical protein
MNAYKDMLDNVVSPITCVSINHQNQLEQMENGAMFGTPTHMKSLNLGTQPLACLFADRGSSKSHTSRCSTLGEAALTCSAQAVVGRAHVSDAAVYI